MNAKEHVNFIACNPSAHPAEIQDRALTVWHELQNPSSLYLDWLADELDRTTDPQRINTIKRVAGNVRALAGI